MSSTMSGVRGFGSKSGREGIVCGKGSGMKGRSGSDGEGGLIGWHKLWMKF
jgi:hypothetical protein